MTYVFGQGASKYVVLAVELKTSRLVDRKGGINVTSRCQWAMTQTYLG